MFDPYYKWLGIRPEHQPPDHYRLLGLERFESDRDVIQAAGERQMAHVQSYKIGPQSELSQRILNEIARAKVCLLNPANKAEYDAGLRAASAPVAPPPAAKSIVTADSIAISESPRGADSSARLRVQRKPNRKPQTLPLVVIAVCLALLIGAVASTFLFDFSGASTRPQAVAPPQTVVTPPAASRRATPGEVGRSMENSRATDLSQPTRRPDRTSSPSPPSGDTRHPIPSSAQVQEARSKFTIQGRLTPTVTLDAAIGATHPWTRYALLQMTIELALQADDASWPEAKRCAFEAARLISAEFQVPSDFNSAIASQFRLRPSESPAKSRNSSAGRPSAPARPTPSTTATNPLSMKKDVARPADINADVLTIDAPLIDLTKSQTEVKFKPLVKVEPRKLILTGLGVTDIQLVRQYPDSGRVELGVPIRVVIRDQPPRAGLEMSLHGTDELYVRIKPMIQDPDDNFYPWTQSGFRDVRRRVERSINAKREETERSERLVGLLSQQLSAATKTAAGIANRKSLQERLDIAKIEAADSRNKLQLLERFVANFSELERQTDKIDRKARVTFRVVRDGSGSEATIVQTAP